MATFAVKSIDHVVLTVKSIPDTIEFYTTRLGMKHEVFTSKGTERHALIFGSQKLNLHQSGKEFEPKAGTVQPGSEDLCFITEHPVDEVLKAWAGAGLEILEGGKVVDRTGAVGKLRSVYCRDPDGNLIESHKTFFVADLRLFLAEDFTERLEARDIFRIVRRNRRENDEGAEETHH